MTAHDNFCDIWDLAVQAEDLIGELIESDVLDDKYEILPLVVAVLNNIQHAAVAGRDNESARDKNWYRPLRDLDEREYPVPAEVSDEERQRMRGSARYYSANGDAAVDLAAFLRHAIPPPAKLSIRGTLGMHTAVYVEDTLDGGPSCLIEAWLRDEEFSVEPTDLRDRHVAELLEADLRAGVDHMRLFEQGDAKYERPPGLHFSLPEAVETMLSEVVRDAFREGQIDISTDIQTCSVTVVVDGKLVGRAELVDGRCVLSPSGPDGVLLRHRAVAEMLQKALESFADIIYPIEINDEWPEEIPGIH